MTSPVHMDVNEGGSTMSFVMPSEYSKETLPKPTTTETVQTRQVPNPNGGTNAPITLTNRTTKAEFSVPAARMKISFAESWTELLGFMTGRDN